MSGVGIDIAQGVLTGTADTMQYSLDSTNGSNGSWSDCSPSSTRVEFDSGHVYVRAKEQPANYRLIADIIPPANAPSTLGISFNVAGGTLMGTADSLQYRTGDGDWTDVTAGGTTTGIGFQPGAVEVRIKATASRLASQPGTVGVIAAPEHVTEFSALLTPDDNTNTVGGLNAAYEYCINSGPWVRGDVTGDFRGIKTVKVRKRATAAELPSDTLTMEFTANTPSISAFNSGSNIGLGAGDRVEITFEVPTNKPQILAEELDDVLELSGGHSWGTGLADTDIAWNAEGNKLTVTFSAVTGATIAANDTITVDRSIIRTAGDEDLSILPITAAIKGTFTSPPAITGVVMSNGGSIGVLDSGDWVTVNFNQNTNKPAITAANLNTWLKLTNLHRWGTNLLNGDMTITWNVPGNVLTITFINVKSPTITAGDAIVLSASAGIKDAAGTTAASTSASAKSTGAF
jgi:hypothetical protein